MVSLPPKVWGGGTFSKKCFSWGTNFGVKTYREIVLHEGTNDQMIPRGKEFHKMLFPFIWTINLKIFPSHGGIFT